MRVLLYTDTLGDVNGVSRFIRNLAETALALDRDLHVVTSTNFACPDQPNIHNLKPIYARPMPAYPQLELTFASNSKLFGIARSMRPDAVHISTPGPIGFIGLRAARRLGVPILGTYHTDFPAYIDHLFDNPSFTHVTTAYMRFFYKRLTTIFTRSADYAEALVDLGVERSRLERLLPGIRTTAFSATYCERAADGQGPRAFWNGYTRIGVDPDAVKVLYVGRVSVEKNLPLLTEIWPRVSRACADKGVRAQLLVIGDGPYRERMEQALTPHGAVMLGFKHGDELSALYACSDLFVFPSLTDTLGQVVMEAQCAGLPVVVSDRGGPSEVVDDQVTGYVCPHDNSGAWVDRLVLLASDPDLRARMSSAGRAKIEPMTFEHSFEHFWDVHRRAVTG